MAPEMGRHRGAGCLHSATTVTTASLSGNATDSWLYIPSARKEFFSPRQKRYP